MVKKLFIPMTHNMMTPPTQTQLLQLQEEIRSDIDFDRYFIMAVCSMMLALISKKDGDKKPWGYINDHPN